MNVQDKGRGWLERTRVYNNAKGNIIVGQSSYTEMIDVIQAPSVDDDWFLDSFIESIESPTTAWAENPIHLLIIGLLILIKDLVFYYFTTLVRLLLYHDGHWNLQLNYAQQPH